MCSPSSLVARGDGSNNNNNNNIDAAWICVGGCPVRLCSNVLVNMASSMVESGAALDGANTVRGEAEASDAQKVCGEAEVSGANMVGGEVKASGANWVFYAKPKVKAKATKPIG